MSYENDKIEALKLKLKHVKKINLSKERDVLKLRNKERLLSDELDAIRAEIDYFSEQLDVLKKQLIQSKQQISLIEICSTSEDIKIEAQTVTLNEHWDGFQQLYDKERQEAELRIKEQKELEAKQLELVRQREMQIAEENAKYAREMAAVEEECHAIERECAVLKKRNNAILLKLRKKLLEAENIRRERMKQGLQTSNDDYGAKQHT